MSSLVTGSSGLLGACLVSRLAEREERLHLLDLLPAAGPVGDGRHAFFQADVCRPDQLEPAARGVEVIYHLAAAQRMKPQFAGWSEREIFERNLEGVRCVLRVARTCEVRKVVFVSSSGVYGVPQHTPCTESHPTRPLGAYGRSKLMAEEMCREAVEQGLDVTVLRPMSLFGPRMTGIFVLLFEWVRSGRPVFMLGSGANRVQAVSAWDVADACVQASRKVGGVYNLGADPGGVPTVRETVDGLIAHAGAGSRVVSIPAALLRAAARGLGLIGLSPIAPEHYTLADCDFILAIDAARRDLGWEPRVGGLEMMIDAYDGYLREGVESQPRAHPVIRLMNRVFPERPRPPA